MKKKPSYEELEQRPKQAEASLRKSEEYFRALIENSIDVFKVIDEKGRIQFASPSVESVLGYKEQELLHMNAFDFVHPDDIDNVAAAFTEVMQHPGVARPAEFRVRAKDGSWIHVDCRGTNLLHNSSVKGIVLNWRDVTEKKRADEDKARLEEQLRQAQKMESIGTMAGGIAHDFNNILGIMVGNTQLAMNDVPEGARAHLYLEEVINASSRARDMVMQILAFSREARVEQKPVHIRAIVEESLKLLRSTSPATIEIREKFSISGDIVLGDATQISQIVVNLFTNATHAMQEKGGVLEVSLKKVEVDEDISAFHPDLKSGEYAILTVSDSGRGMAPGIVERIFDPYFTTKGIGEGTGVGLSVVHGIVKSLGGAIHVESKPGEGSHFFVFFPLMGTLGKTADEFSSFIPTGDEHVLFVDDEPTLAEMGKNMLQLLGYKVTARTCGNEALEVFRTQPDRYDLLITDLTMPKRTGKELAQEIMQIRPGFPVILCTGFSERISEEGANRAGIKAFVTKPIAMRDIARTVRQVLD